MYFGPIDKNLKRCKKCGYVYMTSETVSSLFF